MQRGCLASVVACVFLAACGAVDSANISEMTSPELKAVSDQRLCNRYVSNTPAVMAERSARDLGDCDPGHIECKNMGFKKGTDLYLQCRMQATQIAAQQAAAQQAAGNAMVQQGAAMMKPPTVTNTDCTTFGNSLNCTSRTQP